MKTSISEEWGKGLEGGSTQVGRFSNGQVRLNAESSPPMTTQVEARGDYCICIAGGNNNIVEDNTQVAPPFPVFPPPSLLSLSPPPASLPLHPSPLVEGR